MKISNDTPQSTINRLNALSTDELLEEGVSAEDIAFIRKRADGLADLRAPDFAEIGPSPRSADFRLMEEACEEIDQLRRRNELLSAKVEMVELMRQVLYSTPPQSGGWIAGQDVAQMMRKRIVELKREQP